VISPQSALRRVLGHARPLGTTAVSIVDALGHVLAEDIHARYALPAFDNSAMDGYAVAAAATRAATPRGPVRLEIVDGVYAGDTTRRVLRRGESCAIMTGAPLPRGADCIIPVEAARVDRGALIVIRPAVRGRHVRRKGEEVARGARVARRGTLVHAGTVACLAAAGRRTARVVRVPSVSVISTGDETVTPGRALAHGQVYDSNSHMLAAMLRAAGIRTVRVASVGDRPAALDRAVAAALRRTDVVLLTGGVSVGEHDYVRRVLKALRVREVFWRVRQKPGKPLYFGVRGKKLVFGLPGNPASAFTCFCLYVHPALRRLSGLRGCAPRVEERTLVAPVEGDRTRWSFLRAATSMVVEGGVVVLPRQGSHMITSLAAADRLVVIPPGAGALGAGARVVTYRLPYEGVGA
jgi:molybdopterin molybdotransferase